MLTRSSGHVLLGTLSQLQRAAWAGRGLTSGPLLAAPGAGRPLVCRHYSVNPRSGASFIVRETLEFLNFNIEDINSHKIPRRRFLSFVEFKNLLIKFA